MSEQEFWDRAYIAYITAIGGTGSAVKTADRAVEDRKKRINEENERYKDVCPEPRG